ncbi:hypothetical protein SFRURICE_009644 [Spodoptera frugiperda]|nr:hypothetical protein SFRURICE_009644 [Spodoptera frugiperda]
MSTSAYPFGDKKRDVVFDLRTVFVQASIKYPSFMLLGRAGLQCSNVFMVVSTVDPGSQELQQCRRLRRACLIKKKYTETFSKNQTSLTWQTCLFKGIKRCDVTLHFETLPVVEVQRASSRTSSYYNANNMRKSIKITATQTVGKVATGFIVIYIQIICYARGCQKMRNFIMTCTFKKKVINLKPKVKKSINI